MTSNDATISEITIEQQVVTVVGASSGSADRYGLIDPNVATSTKIKRELHWLFGFGFIAGFAFNWSIDIEIFPELVPIGNRILLDRSTPFDREDFSIFVVSVDKY